MRKKVIVTTSWDDGHILDKKMATLLKKYNLRGTFYISPKDREIDPGKRLSSKEIIEMSKDFEIGAHTMTHPRLSRIKKEEAEKEIKGSKEYLEKLIGKRVNSFCYPGGNYRKIHTKQVEKAGFVLARTIKTYKFKLGKNHFEMPTGFHAYQHMRPWNFASYANYNPFKIIHYYFNWDELAKTVFDSVMRSGGVFHFWGHSWEIDNNNDWERLENVFKYISNRENVDYVINKDLI